MASICVHLHIYIKCILHTEEMIMYFHCSKIMYTMPCVSVTVKEKVFSPFSVTTKRLSWCRLRLPWCRNVPSSFKISRRCSFGGRGLKIYFAFCNSIQKKAKLKSFLCLQQCILTLSKSVLWNLVLNVALYIKCFKWLFSSVWLLQAYLGEQLQRS